MNELIRFSTLTLTLFASIAQSVFADEDNVLLKDSFEQGESAPDEVWFDDVEAVLTNEQPTDPLNTIKPIEISVGGLSRIAASRSKRRRS